MVLLHKLNSAIDKWTKPFSSGVNPCHWTKILKAAIVKANWARKYSQIRCRLCLKWQIVVNMDKTVSMIMRTFHLPLWQIFKLAGLPALEKKPWSARINILSSNARINGWKVVSWTFAVLQSQPQTKPNLLRTKHNLPPTIQRWFENPFLPIWLSLRPCR